MSSVSVDLPLYVAVLGIASIVSAIYVIKIKDLVYASIMLAVLGAFTAGLLSLAGFPIIGAYLVLVYVGAAVMFIIISISMLGPQSEEARDTFRGVVSATAAAMFLLVIIFYSGLYRLYTTPEYVSASAAAAGALSNYLPVLALIFIGQAATVVEAISIARRRGESK